MLNLDLSCLSVYFSLLCSDSKLWTWLCYLLELAVWALMIFGAIVFFDLQVDTTKKLVNSRIGASVFVCVRACM